MHDHILAGHFGVVRTYAAIRRKYYWKNLSAQVRNYILSCPNCSTRKGKGHIKKAPLHPMPVPSQPFERLAVDCLGPFPETHRKNKYIVVFVDHLTKWVESFATPDIQATTIARFLFDEIICRHSTPKSLHSDRGSNFLSNIVKELCKLLQISKTFTSSFHPSGNGLVERSNATIARALSMFVDKNHKDWDVYLPAVMFAFRATPNTETTSFSPFYLVYGREPIFPLDRQFTLSQDLPQNARSHLETIIPKLEIARERERSSHSLTNKRL